MDLGEIRAFLGEDWVKTQDIIADALKSDIELLDRTNAMILSHSGKQLRPMLALLVARACCSEPLGKDSHLAAAASELLHNATLLHDDVADESDKRRGNPTLNSLMGPSVSVLVGDFWLVKAVDCVLDAAESGMDVIRIYASTLRHLAEGEMLQLQKAQSGDTDENDYLRIIYNKTTSLFETSAVAAARSVKASQEQEEGMRRYAFNLGQAFQIRDDIFDYHLDMNVGKPVGADILERKITLPLLGAFRNAGKEAEDRIRKMVTSIGRHPECRDEIVRFVLDNGGLEYAQSRLGDFVDEAVRALDVLRPSEEKDYLVALARFVGSRLS